MRIAIVGPAHPYKGGIAQETTELAHRLTAAGHEVKLLSWKAMYPKVLYPGDQFVPGGVPEVDPFTGTERRLNWKNPAGWWRQVRKLRTYDEVVFIWWVPTIQGPVYLTMLQALGKQGPRTAIVCHNVLPHEPRPGDKALVRTVFNKADRVVVHTPAQAELAKGIADNANIVVTDLPPVLPKGARRTKYKLQHRLLFFGIVRRYKGLDVLLKALAKVKDVQLTVAGEFWGAEQYDRLVHGLKLGNRVEFRKGYVANADLAKLYATADAVVLPYRGGTATYNVAMAHNFGLPVIATTAGSLAQQVHDGVDGLLCEPDDPDDLASTIGAFYQSGVAERLQAGIPKDTYDKEWQAYVKSLTGK